MEDASIWICILISFISGVLFIFVMCWNANKDARALKKLKQSSEEAIKRITEHRDKVEDNTKEDTKNEATKLKVLNKLIVTEKREYRDRILHGGGIIEIVIKYALRVYDTFMDKYDEVIVTKDTYNKAKVNEAFTLDLKQFSHYECINEERLEQIKG